MVNYIHVERRGCSGLFRGKNRPSVPCINTIVVIARRYHFHLVEIKVIENGGNCREWQCAGSRFLRPDQVERRSPRVLP